MSYQWSWVFGEAVFLKMIRVSFGGTSRCWLSCKKFPKPSDWTLNIFCRLRPKGWSLSTRIMVWNCDLSEKTLSLSFDKGWWSYIPEDRTSWTSLPDSGSDRGLVVLTERPGLFTLTAEHSDAEDGSVTVGLSALITSCFTLIKHKSM